MKISKYILALLLLFALSNCGDKKSSDAGNDISKQLNETNSAARNAKIIKKYPLKSGIITFEKNGPAGKSKMVVYFDDYGTKERNEGYNAEGKIEETRFTDGDKMYIINYKYSKDKVAYIMGSGGSGTEMKFVPDPFVREKDKTEYSYKKLPDMNVSGKTCQAYTMKTSAGQALYAGWNNILLYSSVKTSFGDILIKAVDIKEDPDIEASKFKVPQGYEIKKM